MIFRVKLNEYKIIFNITNNEKYVMKTYPNMMKLLKHKK